MARAYRPVSSSGTTGSKGNMRVTPRKSSRNITSRVRWTRTPSSATATRCSTASPLSGTASKSSARRSDPTCLLEPVKQVSVGREDHSQGHRVAEAPAQLGHEIEIHPVDACNHSRYREQRGVGGELFHRLVLVHRDEREVHRNRRRQHFAQ